jgi:hypothetical protein
VREQPVAQVEELAGDADDLGLEFAELAPAHPVDARVREEETRLEPAHEQGRLVSSRKPPMSWLHHGNPHASNEGPPASCARRFAQFAEESPRQCSLYIELKSTPGTLPGGYALATRRSATAVSERG